MTMIKKIISFTEKYFDWFVPYLVSCSPVMFSLLFYVYVIWPSQLTIRICFGIFIIFLGLPFVLALLLSFFYFPEKKTDHQNISAINVKPKWTSRISKATIAIGKEAVKLIKELVVILIYFVVITVLAAFVAGILEVKFKVHFDELRFMSLCLGLFCTPPSLSVIWGQFKKLKPKIK